MADRLAAEITDHAIDSQMTPAEALSALANIPACGITADGCFLLKNNGGLLAVSLSGNIKLHPGGSRIRYAVKNHPSCLLAGAIVTAAAGLFLKPLAGGGLLLLVTLVWLARRRQAWLLRERLKTAVNGTAAPRRDTLAADTFSGPLSRGF